MRAYLTFLLIALATPATAGARPLLTPSEVIVEDGDTIIIAGERWRLVGYDTAEVEDARCEGERRLGLMARRRLAELVASGPLELTDTGKRDRYKRPLGRLSVAGRDVGETLIAELLARPYAGSYKKGWCSRDSRDDLPPDPLPKRER